MTHEGNAQESKNLVLIQKYEAFKMEDEENVENMFLRFENLVLGLKVLDKGYSLLIMLKRSSRVYLSIGDLW